jgi:hypothetical protein
LVTAVGAARDFLVRFIDALVRRWEEEQRAEENQPKVPPTVHSIPRTDSSRLTREQQVENAEYIFDYLSGQGWSIQAIAAVLGNMEMESWFNPGVWEEQNIMDNPRRGYGLMQWSPASKFLEWAGIPDAQAANNMCPKELMDLQLEFLIDSLKTGRGEWFYSNDFYVPHRMFSRQFIESDMDADVLARVFHGYYVRSGDEENTDRVQNRVDSASRWYEYFSNRR